MQDPRIKITPRGPGVRGSVCIGGICFNWNEPDVGFKAQVIGWRRPVFPCLMLGSSYGRQLVYEKSTEFTYFEKEPPLWWLNPSTPADLGGEDVCVGFEDRRVRQACYTYNRLVWAGLAEGPQFNIPASTFRINDYYLEGADAFSRSVKVANLGPQPEGVTVAKIYQANSVETFNTYLEQFQDEGFTGAWVRPNDSRWGDREFYVTAPL